MMFFLTLTLYLPLKKMNVETTQKHENYKKNTAMDIQSWTYNKTAKKSQNEHNYYKNAPTLQASIIMASIQYTQTNFSQ